MAVNGQLVARLTAAVIMSVFIVALVRTSPVRRLALVDVYKNKVDGLREEFHVMSQGRVIVDVWKLQVGGMK